MKIDPVVYYVQKTLPAVFDDSLSYYEAVAKLCAKINEIIEFINNQENEANKYTDEQISLLRIELNKTIDELRNYVDLLNNQMLENIVALQGQINTLDAKVAQELKEYLALFESIRAEVNAQVNLALTLQDEKVQAQLNDLKEYVDNAIIGKIRVFNMFRGSYTDLQTYLDDFYNYSSFPLTAQEYDDLDLTAEGYDNRYIKAYIYDFRGRYLFDDVFKVYSPVTGVYGPIQTALNDLAGLHKQNALTAGEYDGIMITAEAYDAKNISAYNYDYSGKTYVAA